MVDISDMYGRKANSIATQVRWHNKKDVLFILNTYTIGFAAKMLNLKVVKKNVEFLSSASFDYLENEKLDVFEQPIVTGTYYLTYFLIPTGEVYFDVSALVPIIPVY